MDAGMQLIDFFLKSFSTQNDLSEFFHPTPNSVSKQTSKKPIKEKYLLRLDVCGTLFHTSVTRQPLTSDTGIRICSLAPKYRLLTRRGDICRRKMD